MQFGLEREDQRDDRRAGNGEAGLAEAGDEAEADGGQRGDRRGRIRLALEPGRLA